jgi:ribosome biogenesis GTPase
MNPSNPPLGNQGVVIKKHIGSCTVRASGRLVPCALSNKLRKELIYSTADPASMRRTVQDVKVHEHEDPIAVGDEVRFVDAGNGTGLVVEVLPRRNRLARRRQKFEHVIVANVDQVVAVFAAARPTPKWNLLDRYLVAAESLELPILICVTKLDLVPDGDGHLTETLDEYRRIGYPVFLTSAFTGQGLNELQQALKGRLSALVGKSGVGKTALLNAIEPGLGLRVGEVGKGQVGKGKHTTTQVEMVPLCIGGDLVDTPGVREFGLWDVLEDDLALFFPEMRPYVGQCRFGLDCQHDEEPGCAIRKAVMANKIGPRRYQSYMQLKQEVSFL